MCKTTTVKGGGYPDLSGSTNTLVGKGLNGTAIKKRSFIFNFCGFPYLGHIGEDKMYSIGSHRGPAVISVISQSPLKIN